jgi:ferrous iron transport protein A
MNLTELKPGAQAMITDLSKTDRMVRKRLRDLGVTKGTMICLRSVMPLGGPCCFESCGECIGIRRAEAEAIDVECDIHWKSH